MNRIVYVTAFIWFILSAVLATAEEQVQKANPPSPAEQCAPAQPAPAVYTVASFTAAPLNESGLEQMPGIRTTGR